MPGLETKGNVPALDLSGPVALTFPASPIVPADEVGLVLKLRESPREDAVLDESACQWPISFMSRENFKKGEYLFKIGEHG